MPESPWSTDTITVSDVDGQEEGGVTGSATLYIKSRRVNGRIEFVFWLEWGASTSISGTWEFQLPMEVCAPPAAPRLVVDATAYDASEDRYYTGSAILTPIAETSPTQLTISFAFGTKAQLAGATVPFTWASGDWLVAGNVLEAFEN